MPRYTVRQGDCIMSIAEDYGFSWKTIWNHADNAALNQLRQDPNILFPGDVVVVPDKTPRVEPKPTEQRHKFVKKISPAQVRLRLLDLKRQPRPNLQYVAIVDGASSSGKTDGDGYLTINVKPNARQLKLQVTEGSKTEEYTLPLGAIDPIDTLSGVQHRLANLGYPCGTEQGSIGPLTKTALRAFQKEMNLTVSGELDDATRQKLKEIHGT